MKTRINNVQSALKADNTARITWQSPECSDCPLIHIE